MQRMNKTFQQGKKNPADRLRWMQRRGTAGFSLLEVLVSLMALLAGVLMIAIYFPRAVEQKYEAMYRTKAVALAQLKAEEIRLYDDLGHTKLEEIRALTRPTRPLPFPDEPKLSYQFSGVSLLDPIDDSGDPRDDIGVARVIVRYSTDFRPSRDVLYELRFGE
ncbi:hypothetical protein JXA32_04290 [Candidatus Sumerlaeota bacterium]|nr:hypothetical protein [Candidatus Sumerlaeota bacterium]